MRYRTKTTAALGAAIAALLAATPSSPARADAADTSRASGREGPQIDEVVVTSRRRTENLADIPVSISAFTTETIDRRGVASVRDVAALTPGLQFDKGASPADVRPSLRGVALIEGRSNIAIIVDGIDVTGVSLNTVVGGGGSQTAAALMDLERIEVVKGPQAVYFGRSALGGAIQFVSRDPAFETGGKVLAALGSAGRRDVAAHFTGPLIDGVLAGKISAVYNNFDGFYSNPGNGQDLGSEQTAGVAGALLLERGAFRGKARVQYLDEDIAPVPAYVFERPDVTRFGVNRIGEDDFDASRVGISSNVEYAGNQSKTKRAALDLTYEFNESLQLTSLTGLNDVSSEIQFDFDTKTDNVPRGVAVGAFSNCLPQVCVGISDFDTELRQLSQELRLSYTGDVLRGMVGGYYFDESYDEKDFTRFVGSQSFVTASRTGITPRPSALDTKTYALMGSIEGDVTDALTLTAEMRYSREEIEAAAATAFNILFQSGSTAITFRGKETFNSWLPRVSARYRVGEDANVYVSAAKGTKPGGFNVGQVRDDLRPFGQESMWTYELGSKAALMDRRLNVEAAVYYSDWKDVQVTTICYGTASPFGPEAACPTATAVSLNYIINAEKAEVKGVELSVESLLTDSFSIGLRYAYTDSTFADFEARDVFPAPASPINRQFRDNRMPLVPKNSLAADLRLQLPVAEGYSWFSELSGRYRSARYSRFDNRVRLDPKTVVDARVGVIGSNWTALIFADNLFDDLTPDFTRYYGNFNPSRPNGEFLVAPAKRSYGVRVSYDF